MRHGFPARPTLLTQSNKKSWSIQAKALHSSEAFGTVK